MLDEAHAVLGPERRQSTPTPTCCASAPARRRSARSADSSPGPRRYVELIENSSPPVHLHDRADAGRHRRRARRAARCCARPRATRSSRACARTSTGCAPVIRRRSCRSCAATSSAPIDAAAALLEHGLVVPAIRPPTVAPGTSRLRVAMSAAHTDAHVDRLVAALADVFGDAVAPHVSGSTHDVRRRRRDRHRDRQDVGHRRAARCVAQPRHRGRRRASPCSRSHPSDDTPTDAEVLGAATGEDPHAVCPAHRWLPRAMAPPMAADALGSAPFTVRRPRDGDRPELARATRSCSSRASGGVRSPLADDGDTVALVAALQPALVVLVADAELGTINLVRLSVDVLAAVPGGRVPQPLRPRPRAARRAITTGS